jgi:hypothetical protein
MGKFNPVERVFRKPVQDAVELALDCLPGWPFFGE